MFGKRSTSPRSAPDILDIAPAASAPYVRLVNQFLHDFAKSADALIEFTADDLKPNSSSSPLLHNLRGADYDTVRNRLRVISSLDPIVNLEAEEGFIQFTVGSSPHRLRSQFAPRGQSILLEKFQ
jgi:hypothetical protein